MSNSGATRPSNLPDPQASAATHMLPKQCGIVMPISACDGCEETHWSEVLQILSESISLAGFEANLVSNADEVGLIHKRIIHNLYENPIVVCDVSGRNANVMFELGLRLAFDKPTVIVKDEKTAFSFDTSGIEHLQYPRDLRFSKIVEFKERLTEKVRATHEKATNDPQYTTFLKHFGEFKVAKIEKKEVSGQEYILEELRMMRQSLRRLEGNRGTASYTLAPIDLCLEGLGETFVREIAAAASALTGVKSTRVRLAPTRENASPHFHLSIEISDNSQRSILSNTLKSLIQSFRERKLDHKSEHAEPKASPDSPQMETTAPKSAGRRRKSLE